MDAKVSIILLAYSFLQLLESPCLALPCLASSRVSFSSFFRKAYLQFMHYPLVRMSHLHLLFSFSIFRVLFLVAARNFYPCLSCLHFSGNQCSLLACLNRPKRHGVNRGSEQNRWGKTRKFRAQTNMISEGAPHVSTLLSSFYTRSRSGMTWGGVSSHTAEEKSL